MVKSGAPVIVNVTGYRELPTKFLANDPYRLVVSRSFNTNAHYDKNLDLVVRTDWAPVKHLVHALC